MNVNQVSFTGNLGADPEMSYTQSGKAWTKMRFAVWQGKDKDSMWISATCWEELAERCSQNLHRGQEIFVTGRLTMRTYTDKNGIERQAYEVSASSVQPTQRAERGAPPKEYVGATSRASRTADDFDKDDYGDHPF